MAAPVLHRDDPDAAPLVGNIKVTRQDWLNVALDVLIQRRRIHRLPRPSRLRLPPVSVDVVQNRTMGADGHRRAIPSGLCRYLDTIQLSQRGRN